MAGTLKEFGLSVLSRIFKFAGCDKLIEKDATNALSNSSRDAKQISEILAREFHTNDDVKKALVDLSEIGTQGAAEGIIELMDSPRPRGYGFPLANGELVLFAASCLKKMEHPAFYLGKLIHVESEWYENRNASRYALEKDRLEDNTHERKLIDDIVKIGGEEAKEALNEWVLDHYPAQTQVAIRRLSLPDNMASFEDFKRD